MSAKHPCVARVDDDIAKCRLERKLFFCKQPRAVCTVWIRMLSSETYTVENCFFSQTASDLVNFGKLTHRLADLDIARTCAIILHTLPREIRDHVYQAIIGQPFCDFWTENQFSALEFDGPHESNCSQLHSHCSSLFKDELHDTWHRTTCFRFQGDRGTSNLAAFVNGTILKEPYTRLAEFVRHIDVTCTGFRDWGSDYLRGSISPLRQCPLQRGIKMCLRFSHYISKLDMLPYNSEVFMKWLVAHIQQVVAISQEVTDAGFVVEAFLTTNDMTTRVHSGFSAERWLEHVTDPEQPESESGRGWNDYHFGGNSWDNGPE